MFFLGWMQLPFLAAVWAPCSLLLKGKLLEGFIVSFPVWLVKTAVAESKSLHVNSVNELWWLEDKESKHPAEVHTWDVRNGHCSHMHSGALETTLLCLLCSSRESGTVWLIAEHSIWQAWIWCRLLWGGLWFRATSNLCLHTKGEIQRACLPSSWLSLARCTFVLQATRAAGHGRIR